MKLPPNVPLPDDIDALKQLVLVQHSALEERQTQLVQKQARIQFLEEQIMLFKHRQF